MNKYAICPACRGVVDSTVKKAALSQTETGYRDEITVNCPTCCAQIVARLEWTPVIVLVKLVEKTALGGE